MVKKQSLCYFVFNNLIEITKYTGKFLTYLVYNIISLLFRKIVSTKYKKNIIKNKYIINLFLFKSIT